MTGEKNVDITCTYDSRDSLSWHLAQPVIFETKQTIIFRAQMSLKHRRFGLLSFYRCTLAVNTVSTARLAIYSDKSIYFVKDKN